MSGPRRGRDLKGRCLTFAQREEIAVLRAQGHSLRRIGVVIDPSASTVSRELRRNSVAGLPYRATRIGPARCSETGSVYWIHSDVDAGPPPRADQVAVVQHRCSVFLSFADDNSSGDIDGGKIGTQCINRCCVGGILIAAADPPLRADRGRFRSVNKLQCDAAVQRHAAAGPDVPLSVRVRTARGQRDRRQPH